MVVVAVAGKEKEEPGVWRGQALFSIVQQRAYSGPRTGGRGSRWAPVGGLVLVREISGVGGCLEVVLRYTLERGKTL